MQLKRFKFFALELGLPSSEHLSPSLAGVSVEDVVFAEVDNELFDGAVEMDRGGPLELPDDDDRSIPVDENEDEEMSVGTN
jgi:hypothetical protein